MVSSTEKVLTKKTKTYATQSCPVPLSGLPGPGHVPFFAVGADVAVNMKMLCCHGNPTMGSLCQWRS